MLLMGRIGHGLQEVLVARSPADILRRAGALAVHAERVPHPGIRQLHLLNVYAVLPVVAEVVAVNERKGSGRQVGEGGLAGVVRGGGPSSSSLSSSSEA